MILEDPVQRIPTKYSDLDDALAKLPAGLLLPIKVEDLQERNQVYLHIRDRFPDVGMSLRQRCIYASKGRFGIKRYIVTAKIAESSKCVSYRIRASSVAQATEIITHYLMDDVRVRLGSGEIVWETEECGNGVRSFQRSA